MAIFHKGHTISDPFTMYGKVLKVVPLSKSAFKLHGT